MVAKKLIPSDRLAEAKRLYEQTAAPVDDIADMVGMSRTTFYERLQELGWRSRRSRPAFNLARAVSEAVTGPFSEGQPPFLPQSAVVTIMDAAALAQQRVAIAQRMLTIAEREMDAIERIIAVLQPADALEADHSARTLASVSRTLSDIAQLAQPAEKATTDEPHDDSVPRDIDEFRRTLAIRIEALIDEESESSSKSAGETVGGPG